MMAQGVSFQERAQAAREAIYAQHTPEPDPYDEVNPSFTRARTDAAMAFPSINLAVMRCTPPE